MMAATKKMVKATPHISHIQTRRKEKSLCKKQRDGTMFNYQPQGALNQTDRDILSARYRFANANMI